MCFNNLLKCFAILQQCAPPPPRQALFNGILLWASSFECHVWKCAAHTHYTKMEVITKSPTLLSIQSVLMNLPKGVTFKPTPFFIYRHDFFFLNQKLFKLISKNQKWINGETAKISIGSFFQVIPTN